MNDLEPKPIIADNLVEYNNSCINDDDDDDDDDVPTLVSVQNNMKSNYAVDGNSVERIIPITILTGFLGAGKTTLLRHILTENHGKRIAVIENELSVGLGIEQMIAMSGVTGTPLNGFFELNNGCICCSVKDNLLATLEQLSKHPDRFDYILIEMTGVANPGPVISTFWVDEGLHSSLKLDGIICVVDAVHIEGYLVDQEIANDVCMQICYADRILINKCDLISSQKSSEIRDIVQKLNGLAHITNTSLNSKVSVDWVLDIHGYDSMDIHGLGIESNLDKKGLSNIVHNGNICQPCVSATNGSVSAPPAPHIASILSTEAISFSGEFNLTVLEKYMDNLLYRKQPPLIETSSSTSENEDMQIYRVKGVIRVKGEDSLYILVT